MKHFFPILCLLGLLLQPVLAETVAGVNLSDTSKVGETNLVLNGVGVRKATWFRVKVYVAGLYLTSKEQQPRAILESSSPKRLVMHFVRGVEADKLTNGWTEGFEKNVTDLTPLKDRLNQFNSYMSDIQEGEVIDLTFQADGVGVSFAGALKGTIPGQDFAQALLSVWLGPKPPNEDLKEGLLGKS